VNCKNITLSVRYWVRYYSMRSTICYLPRCSLRSTTSVPVVLGFYSMKCKVWYISIAWGVRSTAMRIEKETNGAPKIINIDWGYWKMLLKEFYRRVILTEEAALTFLREHNILDKVHEADPCHKCGSVMQEKRKRNRVGDFKPVLRCPWKGCQITRSVCTGT